MDRSRSDLLVNLKRQLKLKVLVHLRRSRHPKWLSAGVSAASTSWTQSEREADDRTDYPTVQRAMLFKQSPQVQKKKKKRCNDHHYKVTPGQQVEDWL